MGNTATRAEGFETQQFIRVETVRNKLESAISQAEREFEVSKTLSKGSARGFVRFDIKDSKGQTLLYSDTEKQIPIPQAEMGAYTLEITLPGDFKRELIAYELNREFKLGSSPGSEGHSPLLRILRGHPKQDTRPKVRKEDFTPVSKEGTGAIATRTFSLPLSKLYPEYLEANRAQGAAR